jgi:GTP-binding protein EngB required for normal cell division
MHAKLLWCVLSVWNTDPIPQVILLGDGAVGKTSIANRYVHSH